MTTFTETIVDDAALAVPQEEAIRIRDDVGSFQAVQSVLAKRTLVDPQPGEDLDHAIRQIVARPSRRRARSARAGGVGGVALDRLP